MAVEPEWRVQKRAVEGECAVPDVGVTRVVHGHSGKDKLALTLLHEAGRTGETATGGSTFVISKGGSCRSANFRRVITLNPSRDVEDSHPRLCAVGDSYGVIGVLINQNLFAVQVLANSAALGD